MEFQQKYVDIVILGVIKEEDPLTIPLFYVLFLFNSTTFRWGLCPRRLEKESIITLASSSSTVRRTQLISYDP